MFYLKCLAVMFTMPIYSIVTIIGCLVRFKNPSNVWYAAYSLHIWLKYLVGVRVKIISLDIFKKVDQSGPYVYVVNHQSALDLGIHGHCLTKRTVGVGKKEILWVPFFGLIFWLCGNVLIDRKNRKNAFKTMSESLEAIKTRKVSIWIYPEGTRNLSADLLLPFKKGPFYLAIDAQIPVVPVVAARTTEFFNFKKRIFKSGTVEVEFLDPIPTTGLQRNQVDELIKQVRDKMLESIKNLKIECRGSPKAGELIEAGRSDKFKKTNAPI